MSNRVKLGCPEVRIPEKVWKRLMAYIVACPMEVGGLGTVEVVGDIMMVTDVFLLEQEVTAATTELDPAALNKFIFESFQNGMDVSKLKFWWHSHAEMPVMWSSTDVNTMKELADEQFLISLVGNHKREHRTRITINKPFELNIDNIAIKVIEDEDPALAEAAMKEIDEKVKQRKPFLSFARKRKVPTLAEENFDDIDLSSLDRMFSGKGGNG